MARRKLNRQRFTGTLPRHLRKHLFDYAKRDNATVSAVIEVALVEFFANKQRAAMAEAEKLNGITQA